jgi:hypothetical protein
LLFVSRWKNPDAAAQFAAVYTKSLKARYKRATAVTGDIATETTPTTSSAGKHAWLTEQGPVIIEVRDDIVFVSESLDQPTTDELERQIFSASAKEK